MNFYLRNVVKSVTKTVFFFCLTIYLSGPTLYAKNSIKQNAQSAMFKSKMSQYSFSDVLKILEERENVVFVYDKNISSLDIVVSLNLKTKKLDDILYDLARQTGVSFRRINNTISIKKDRELSDNLNTNEGKKEKRIIKGEVKDVKTKEELIGVTIIEKGSSNGTVTNVDGDFELGVHNGATIQVSYIGYLTQEIKISENSQFEIELKSDVRNIGEVVVVGYGSQSKANISGAIENVHIEGITERPVNNMLQALQGNVPGVTVINNGGDPTETPTVRIRGIGTLSNEAPLYVVDGVPGASIPNVEDIKTIAVLKDASSSAIYGVRAAAGVILIETKKGKNHSGHIGLNYYVGINNVANKLHSLDANQYADVMNLAFDHSGYSKDDAIRNYVNPSGNPYGMVTRTDWVDAIFRTGTVQNYNITVDGAKDNMDYYTSIHYRKNEGTLLNTWHEVFDFRMNTNFRFKDRLTLSENVSYQFSNGNYGTDTSSGYTGAIISAIYYPSSASIWADQDNAIYGGVASSDSKYIGSYGDLINPVAYLNRLNDKKPTHLLNGNFKVRYDFFDGLFYLMNAGAVINLNSEKSFASKITEPGKIFDFNQLNQSTNQSFSWIMENTLNYSHLFGKNQVEAVMGYTSQKFVFNWFSMSAQGFSSEATEHQYFSNAAGPFGSPVSGKTGNILLSYFMRANYNYDSRFLLTLIARHDGSSKLSSENRWGTFPSVSAAWRIKNEEFIKNVTFISDLKLRGGWGRIGNLGALSDFPSSVPLTRTKSLLGSPANYDTYLGYAENQISNPDISWESTSQTNLGLDYGLMDNKLTGSVDYFVKNTDKMLLQSPVQGTAGVSYGPWENVGSIQNKGIEISIGYSDSDNAFKYGANINFSSVKNEVKSLSNYYDYISHDVSVRGILKPLRTAVGQPIYSYYVYQNDGIFKNKAEVSAYKNQDGVLLQPLAQPGDLKFVDRNKNGKLDADDRYFAGSGFPKFTIGLNGNMQYRNFDLQFLFQGVLKFKVFNGMKYSTLKPTQGYNMLSDILGAWSESNVDSNIPRISFADENNNFGTVSDWYLEDASYLRLKNVTVGYTLPSTFASKIGLQGAKIYLSADNLLTFTKYSGFDPEVISDHGIDMGKYPLPQTYIMGINVNF